MNLDQFFKWEQATRDTIDVKKIYIDVADDLVAGVLLSQIAYWFLPNKEGKTKLRVRKEGFLWLVKGRDDWWEECRIKARQYDTAIKKLIDRGIIIKATYKFDGNPMTHIRINWTVFLSLLKNELDKLENVNNTDFHEYVKTELGAESIDNTGFHESVITESRIRDNVLSESVKTLTENTTEITMIADEAHTRESESIKMTFEEWANNRELPVEIANEIQKLITKEKIEFDLEMYNYYLDKTLPRYTAGKITSFAPYFVSVLKKEREKQQLAQIEVKKAKPTRYSKKSRKRVPEYILLQVERDRAEEREMERKQLESETDLAEVERLIEELKKKRA